MRIVAISQQKGGAGKSTVAQGLAVEAAIFGYKTAIVDVDPQGSTAAWSRRRGETDVHVFKLDDGGDLGALIAQHREDFDVIFLDTPPTLTGTNQEAVRLADAVIVPVRPSPNDLLATVNTIRMIRELGKTPQLVLNGVRTNGGKSLVASTRAALTVFDCPVYLEDLKDRLTHQYAAAVGQGAQEYDPNGAAAQELKELFNWFRITALH